MKPKIISLIALILIIAGGVTLYTQILRASSDGNTNMSIEKPEEQVEQPKYQVDEVALSKALNAIIESSPMEVSIAITDLTTGAKYRYGEVAPYTAASVTKLLTATMYLHEVEQGSLSLDGLVGGKSARAQLEQLIVNSDNAAWDALVIKLKWAGLTAYAKEIGITSFDPASNVITAEDMTLLLAGIYKQELLNKEHTELLLGFMERAGEHEHVPAITTPGITAYHKAGWLTDRVHDALIIKNDEYAFAMSVFTKTTGPYDVAAGIDFFNRINTTTIDAFLLNQP